jgi:putative ABC transport system ATP-binding protein
LADEPTGNLDSQSQSEIMHLLDDLGQRQGLTIVLVTHSSEVASAASRVIRLRDGRVLES